MGEKKDFSGIKKIVGTALLLGAVIYTGYSCTMQDRNEKTIDDLPRITNRSEMEAALSGPKTMYAVLDAPVIGSPADDAFDILTDDYFFIMYSGEMIKSSIYYLDGLGAQTSYAWEESGNIRKSVSSETYFYDDIPIDLTDCIMDKPDGLSSEDQFELPKNTKGFVNIDADYYYPDGLDEDYDDMEANCGRTRYRISFMKSGTSLSFLAWVGDNKISVYKADGKDDIYSLPTVVQHGDISDLKWIITSGDVGGIFFVWIFVSLIIFVMIYTSAYKEEEETQLPSEKKKKPTQKKKGKRKNADKLHWNFPIILMEDFL